MGKADADGAFHEATTSTTATTEKAVRFERRDHGAERATRCRSLSLLAEAESGDGTRRASVEGLDRLADAGSTRPVVHRRHHPIERRIDVVRTEQMADPGEPGGEDEGFDSGAGGFERVGEIQQQSRIPLHRAA